MCIHNNNLMHTLHRLIVIVRLRRFTYQRKERRRRRRRRRRSRYDKFNERSPLESTEFKDMFIAGTDTSSATIVWTMTELIKNPSVMKKAQDVVRSVAKAKPKFEKSDLSKLTYLKMVIKEGLRLHPPVPMLVPRETTERCTVGGYEIPSKTRVLVNVKVIGMDLAYWENPSEFRPERFVDGSIDFRGRNFELLPFGAGRRSCPGINFVVPSIEHALANFLHRFNWALPEWMREEDVDMDEAFGLTMHKKIPLCLIASPANI